jgi:hypothetical protein
MRRRYVRVSMSICAAMPPGTAVRACIGSEEDGGDVEARGEAFVDGSRAMQNRPRKRVEQLLGAG